MVCGCCPDLVGNCSPAAFIELVSMNLRPQSHFQSRSQKLQGRFRVKSSFLAEDIAERGKLGPGY